MTKTNPLRNSLVQGWQKTPAWQQRLLAVVLIGLTATSIWVSINRSREMCPLIDGRDLLPEEIQRIQLALAQANITDFELDGSRILVKRNSLARAIKATIEHDAMPEELQNRDNEGPAVNFLMPRQQQDWAFKNDKQKQIREMVSKLQFVRQVDVQLDMTQAAGPFANRQYSCVVSVLPHQQQPLTKQQLVSVGEVALGCVAGMNANNLVIVDRESTVAFSYGLVAEGAQMEVAYQTQREVQETIRLKSDIEEMLADFPGSRVEITNTKLAPPIQQNEPELKTEAAPPTQLMVGTNSSASVPAHVTSSRNTPPLLPLPSSSPSPEVSRKVRVAIPEMAIRERLQSQFPDEVPDEAIAIKFDEVKISLEKQLRRLADADSESIQYDFNIALDASGSENGSSPLSIKQIAIGPRNGAMIAIASGLGLCLFFFVSMSRRKPRSSDKAFENVDSPEIRSLREKIDSLIENDPETVANVLKDWIRKND
ncbi:MAG: hypothetical protein R3C03_05820 [Pirellulaceae bacterium]